MIIIFFCFNRYEAHYGLPLGRKKTAKSVSATYKYGSVVFTGASLNNLDIRNCNWGHLDKGDQLDYRKRGKCFKPTMIFLPLHPGSQTHKNPQRHKIIHEMRPVGHKERLIDLKIFW